MGIKGVDYKVGGCSVVVLYTRWSFELAIPLGDYTRSFLMAAASSQRVECLPAVTCGFRADMYLYQRDTVVLEL
jgi:hypothetical protein